MLVWLGIFDISSISDQFLFFYLYTVSVAANDIVQLVYKSLESNTNFSTTIIHSPEQARFFNLEIIFLNVQ